MGVTLRRPHRQPRQARDLREVGVQVVLHRHHTCLGRRQFGQTAAEFAPGLGCGQSRHRVTVARGPVVHEQRLGAAERPGLSQVLTGVDDQAVEPGRELGLATKLTDTDDQLGQGLLGGVAGVLRVTEQVRSQTLDPGSVPLTQGSESALVAGLGPGNQDGVGKPAVVERLVSAELMADWTPAGRQWLHGRLTLVTDGPGPEIVLPRLRGRFGRPYLYAVETASTQRLPPADAPHGTVAVAEHQTEGRGRLGRVWVDDAGAGLALSIVLRPPRPVARWPELTLVAARAVAGAIGERATIKEPNDVLVDGRKAAGILAEASGHVVLGIGVNVGSAPWPGAGFVAASRLELLVEILDRLERGYSDWESSLADGGSRR